MGFKVKDMTTLNDLHYPMGSKSGLVYLHSPQEWWGAEFPGIQIFEAKRRLHPPKNQTFTSPKQKDVYIPEAKRRLHPRKKNPFTSPKQKVIYNLHP